MPPWDHAYQPVKSIQISTLTLSLVKPCASVTFTSHTLSGDTSSPVWPPLVVPFGAVKARSSTACIDNTVGLESVRPFKLAHGITGAYLGRYLPSIVAWNAGCRNHADAWEEGQLDGEGYMDGFGVWNCLAPAISISTAEDCLSLYISTGAYLS